MQQILTRSDHFDEDRFNQDEIDQRSLRKDKPPVKIVRMTKTMRVPFSVKRLSMLMMRLSVDISTEYDLTTEETDLG